VKGKLSGRFTKSVSKLFAEFGIIIKADRIDQNNNQNQKSHVR
jgi:hypothetical protein